MTRRTLKEYRSDLVTRLRAYELKRAGSDDEAIHALSQMSDGLLLRKWLWIGTVTGGLASFIVMPMIMSVISAFMPQVIIDVLWFLLKTVMALLLAVFILLVYVTVRSET